MSALIRSVQTVLLFVLLGIPGFLLGKTGRIRKEAVGSIGHILLDVSLPCLVFAQLAEADPDAIGAFSLVACLVFPVLIIFGVLFVGRWILPDRDGKKSVCLLCGAFSNCGFMGIPMSQMMFPDDPTVTVCVSVFNAVNSLLLLTAGARLLSDDKKGGWKKALFCPMTAAFLLGAVVCLSGIVGKLSFLVKVTDTLGGMATPLSLTVLGFELSGMKFGKKTLNAAFAVTAGMKLLLAPLAALGLLGTARLCGFRVSRALAMGMLIASGVPTAASAPSLAEQNGCDGETASVLTLGNTLLSLATLPLILTVGELIF